MNAKVYCDGTRIRCLHEIKLTVGMSGAPIEFDFSSEWDGLGKTAVFTCDGTKDVILDAEGKAVVPHEILTTPGMDVVVGVYAVHEDGTTWPAPTPLCRIGRVEAGADPSGDESYPPTPDVGEQAAAAASKALEAAAEAQEAAADIQRRADAGEFDGKDGSDGGYYTPAVTQPDDTTMRVNFTPSKAGMPTVLQQDIKLPKGSSVTLDPTLTVEGKAADAKAVGNALAMLEEQIPEVPTVPSALPNPYKLTFTGAVSAEYDGSEAVSVYIPQGYTKAEIDAIMGNYIADIDNLVGGDS